MVKTTIILLCLVTLAFGQPWIPTDFQTTQNPSNPNEYQTRIGGELMFYPNAGEWEPIQNGWTETGHGAGIQYICLTDIMQASVDRLGTSIATVNWGDSSFIITQDFVGIVVENTITNEVWDFGFNNPSFGTPNIIGDTLRWEIYTGLWYEVIKKNAALIHRISFAADLSQQAINWCINTFGTLENLAVSTNMDISMTNLAMPPIGNRYETEFKNFGKYQLAMRRQALQNSIGDTLSEPIEQRWTNGNMKERVHLPNIQAILNANPNAVIWHNDEISIGAANIENSYIRYSADADNNYGGALAMFSRYNYPENIYRPIIKVLDISSVLPEYAIISACVCSLFVFSGTDFDPPDQVGMYRVFKPWVRGDENGVDNDDGDVTGNDWVSDTYEWTTQGCNNADDGGSDNSGDGTGADRKSTAEDILEITGIGWYPWDISAELAQGWYDGTINENGVILCSLLSAPAEVYYYYAGTLYEADATKRPRFSLIYTTGEPPPAAANRSQVISIH